MRRYTTSLSDVYKVAFGAASGSVAYVVGEQELLAASHEIALMTVRRFHEEELVDLVRAREGTE